MIFFVFLSLFSLVLHSYFKQKKQPQNKPQGKTKLKIYHTQISFIWIKEAGNELNMTKYSVKNLVGTIKSYFVEESVFCRVSLNRKTLKPVPFFDSRQNFNPH